MSFVSGQAGCLASQKEKKAGELVSSDKDSSDEGRMQVPKGAKRMVSRAVCLLVGMLTNWLCRRRRQLESVQF